MQSDPNLHEKSIAFVVPVHGASGLFLSRCLNSLLDNQDYPHKKVIVVFDGDEYQMGFAKKQEEKFADDDRICFVLKEHAGAPSARNYGLDYVREHWPETDYICFYDCDSILKAGAIRTWLKTFDENPDVGFVYGGYRFTLKDSYNSGIPAQKWDYWKLTCNNYISTMNPIKLELCPRWNEKLKALQDWHFWLQVGKAGVTGKYIPEWLTITEIPSEESISTKGHQNWLECYNAVRDDIGIPRREIAVYSLGAFFQSERRAKILGGDYRDVQMLSIKPNDYKAIISMGFYCAAPVPPFMGFANANENCKKIIHWIGTDVSQLQTMAFKDVNMIRKWLPGNVDKQFVNAPWLQSELAEIGITAELLYCPIDANNYKISPVPEKFTVAVYRSDTNNVHNESFLKDVARSCPDILFKFFGGTKPLMASPKNVEYVGTVEERDMNDFIASTSCIIRITTHDGFPATIAEWVMSGRPFISNLQEMPFNRYLDVNPSQQTFFDDKEKTIKAIRDLQRKMPNLSSKNIDMAKAHYAKLLNPETYIKRINEVVYG